MQEGGGSKISRSHGSWMWSMVSQSVTTKTKIVKWQRDSRRGCGKISTTFLYLKLSLSINVAYNDDPYWFEIVNNSMVEWYDYWGLIIEKSSRVRKRHPYSYCYNYSAVVVQSLNCVLLNVVDKDNPI